MATYGEFLESTAPYEIVSIDDLETTFYSGSEVGVTLPSTALSVDLFCANSECDTVRHFDCQYPQPFHGAVLRFDEAGEWKLSTQLYKCRYCRTEKKVIVHQLRMVEPEGDERSFEAVKLGEWPPFGIHLPSRVVTVLRDDRDLLFKAKKALNAGLGIGAFAYYRRVVENQKVGLFNEIIRTGKAIEVDESVLTALEAARDERQFSRAIEMGRDAIPDRLLIAGQNPFTLLHDALSEGLHAERDEPYTEAEARCLELAGAIEKVLVTVVREMDHVRRDRDELQSAIRTLSNRTSDPEAEIIGPPTPDSDSTDQ